MPIEKGKIYRCVALLKGQVSGSSLVRGHGGILAEMKRRFEKTETNSQGTSPKRKQGWNLSGMRGIEGAPLELEDRVEDSEMNNLRIVGGDETTDLEFSPLSESSGAKEDWRSVKNQEGQRAEKWHKGEGDLAGKKEWRVMGKSFGQWVSPEFQWHKDTVTFYFLSLSLCRLQKSIRRCSFKMLYFLPTFCFHSLDFHLRHKYTRSGQLVKSIRSLSQISGMYTEFHSSSPSTRYINIPEAYRHP